MGLIASLIQRSRRFRLSLRHGVKLGTRIDVGTGVVCTTGAGRIEIGDDSWLGPHVVLAAHGGSIVLDKWVSLGPGTAIYGHAGVQIGEATIIAMSCSILSSNHTVPRFGTSIRTQPDILLPTKIGRDVWLGAGVTVLGGVTIGDGCVVGAGSVVTKDLPAGAIAFGTPATVRRFREGAPTPPPAAS